MIKGIIKACYFDFLQQKAKVIAIKRDTLGEYMINWRLPHSSGIGCGGSYWPFIWKYAVSRE